MNTPLYIPPPKERPPLDKVCELLYQARLKVQQRKEKNLEIGRGETVLVVDDDLVFLEIAGCMVTRLGFTVLEAKDGVEAVARLL